MPSTWPFRGDQSCSRRPAAVFRQSDILWARVHAARSALNKSLVGQDRLPAVTSSLGGVGGQSQGCYAKHFAARGQAK